MADNNTLDDLILTDPEPEKGKSKGLLALLALIILLIIVGAILAKMIFSSSDDIKTDANKTQEPNVKTVIDDNSNNNASANLDIKDPDLAPLDDLNDSIDNTNAESEEVEGGIVEDGTPSQSKEKTQSKTKTDKKKESQNETAQEPEVQGVVVEKQKSNTIAKQEHKVKPKQKPKHTQKVYGGHGTVYIQVGSFVKGPESSFIEKIRRAGFRFRIKEQGGKRRVYVGPFRSREEAKSLLNIVRSKINPDAFIK